MQAAITKLKISALCVLSALIIIIPGGDAKTPELRTVPYADVNRYMGSWYEIAKIPHWFESGLEGTMVTYSPLPDGKVLTTIKAYKNNFEGKYYYKVLKADIADKKTNAEIVVRFFLFFTGTFYIIELGDNYDYAVVGNTSREKLWILSRTPRMDPALYEALLKRIEANGYDVSQLEKTIQ